MSNSIAGWYSTVNVSLFEGKAG